MAGKTTKKETLRPDTTLAPVGEPEAEVYVRGLPACCLRSLKETVVANRGEGTRMPELRCFSCGWGWRVTSSLDERVLGRFVAHDGPR